MWWASAGGRSSPEKPRVFGPVFGGHPLGGGADDALSCLRTAAVGPGKHRAALRRGPAAVGLGPVPESDIWRTPFGCFLKRWRSSGRRALLPAWVRLAAVALAVYYALASYGNLAVGLGKLLGFDLCELICRAAAVAGKFDAEAGAGPAPGPARDRLGPAALGRRAGHRGGLQKPFCVVSAPLGRRGRRPLGRGRGLSPAQLCRAAGSGGSCLPRPGPSAGSKRCGRGNRRRGCLPCWSRWCWPCSSCWERPGWWTARR